MKRFLNRMVSVFLVTGGLLVIGCEQAAEEDMTAADTTGTETVESNVRAVANLEPTEGNNVRGTVTFLQEDDNTIRITGTITGLAPGEHGFHVHEVGDCSAPDASSAGPHFNPTGAVHGGPDAAMDQRHVGDLGNIQAGADSTAAIDITDDVIAFEGTNSIVGRALVVHETADDLATDPSGNSGARLACGVIQLEGGGM
jgi:Cu-Zn family superoxide dismutase